MLEELREAGRRIRSYDSVLEEGLPMTLEWRRPVRAVLDHFELDDVTLVGFSLGGCLVMHGAAGEPRVRRVVANDVLTDFAEVAARQVNPVARQFMRWANFVPTGMLNLGITLARRRNRVVDWASGKGCAYSARALPPSISAGCEPSVPPRSQHASRKMCCSSPASPITSSPSASLAISC